MKNKNFYVATIVLLLVSINSFAQSNIFPASGSVGIGTTAPGAKLDVNGSVLIRGFETATNVLSFRSDIPDGTNVGIRAKAITTTNRDGLELLGYNGLDFSINNSATVAMHINGQTTTGPGNVGIGTVFPSFKLHVSGDIYSSGVVRIASTNPLYFNDYDGGWYMQDASWVRTYNSKSVWTGGGLIGTDGGITSGYGGASPPSGGAIIAGNVGIGTTAPAAKLHVSGSDVTDWIRIQSTAAGVNGTLDMYTSGTGGFIPGTTGFNTSSSSAPIVFAVNSSEVMRVTNGNVGIGTTTPSEKLSINGNIKAKKLIVTQTGWADYVFQKDYQLPPIIELEKYIKSKKHLPEIPSSAEIDKKGINVG